jgi:hypothetical protein
MLSTLSQDLETGSSKNSPTFPNLFFVNFCVAQRFDLNNGKQREPNQKTHQSDNLVWPWRHIIQVCLPNLSMSCKHMRPQWSTHTESLGSIKKGHTHPKLTDLTTHYHYWQLGGADWIFTPSHILRISCKWSQFRTTSSFNLSTMVPLCIASPFP